MMRFFKYLLFTLLVALIGQIYAADKKGSIAIELHPVSASENDRLTATAFGISLAHWYETTGKVESLNNGFVEPGPQALKHAFSSQIQIWRELNEKEHMDNEYMHQLMNVDNAGYLDEYIWHYHRKESWPISDAPNKLEAFDTWASENLGQHKPRIEARLNVTR